MLTNLSICFFCNHHVHPDYIETFCIESFKEKICNECRRYKDITSVFTEAFDKIEMSKVATKSAITKTHNKVQTISGDIKLKRQTLLDLAASNDELEKHLFIVNGEPTDYKVEVSKKTCNTKPTNRDTNFRVAKLIQHVDPDYTERCKIPAIWFGVISDLREKRRELLEPINKEKARTRMLQKQIKIAESFIPGTGSVFLETKEHFNGVQSVWKKTESKIEIEIEIEIVS